MRICYQAQAFDLGSEWSSGHSDDGACRSSVRSRRPPGTADITVAKIVIVNGSGDGATICSVVYPVAAPSHTSISTLKI